MTNTEVALLIKLAARHLDHVFAEIAELTSTRPDPADARWHGQADPVVYPVGAVAPRISGGMATTAYPWSATLYDPRLETPDAPPPAEIEPGAVYAIPGAPPTGRRVTDGNHTWQRVASGLWFDIEWPGEDTGRWEWVDLLRDHGPLRLVPLTVQEHADAVLYGPAGARWGDPLTPCPYFTDTDTLRGGQPQGVCALGVGHVGPHTDSVGQALGQTPRPPDDAPVVSVGVTPQQAAHTPCTCGNPARHQQGCARYPFGPRTINTRGIH